jgi:hypothetical protein
VTPSRRETVLRVLGAAPARRFHAVELLALTRLPWVQLAPELDALVRDGWVESGPSPAFGPSPAGSMRRRPRVWWLAPLPGQEAGR